MAECRQCSAWLDKNDIVEYGTYCEDCVDGHDRTVCVADGCALCKMIPPLCYDCNGPVEKVEDIKDPNHVCPHQYYRCDTCAQFVVRCKGCYCTTVNWYEAIGELWDDCGQCSACGAVFCPTCDQSYVGCRSVDDDCEIRCDACPDPPRNYETEDVAKGVRREY